MENKYTILHNEREQQILDAAKALILRKGIAGTTMLDIAKECGISRQRLYSYFDCLDAIIFAIQGDIFNRAVHNFETIFTESLSDAVTDFIDYMVSFYQQNREALLFTCLFDAYVCTHEAQEAVDSQYHQMILDYSFAFSELFQGKGSPIGTDGVTFFELSHVVINTILALISRMALLGDHYARDGAITKERVLEIYKQIIVSYLKTNGFA